MLVINYRKEIMSDLTKVIHLSTYFCSTETQPDPHYSSVGFGSKPSFYGCKLAFLSGLAYQELL